MRQPKIAFCTTCKGRAQHLARTLSQNIEDNRNYENCTFVILDYDSRDHLKPFLQSEQWRESISSGQLAVYSYREPTPFRVAHAKNMAHRAGILEGAEILVNLDADNFTGEGFAQFIAEQFDARENIFLWSRMIQQGPDRLPRGINGRIGALSKAFLHVGGYDERFAVWSPDDKDFNLRLRRIGYQPCEIDRRFLNCIPHNDKLRFKHHSTHENCEDISDETVDSSDTIIVNQGKIGVGTVYKNFADEPIQLNSLPTRIFGIGMHKTATTSLHHALGILGFESAHWKSAHWAKAIWDEMQSCGRSFTLEKSYALSDLPITLLYEKLDAGYPGSKFILTTRDENKWIESVKNHWDRNHNRFRDAWDTDPFTHKIHKQVYGQKGFNAELFLSRYRRHNAEVTAYFKDRPGQLLMMEMDKGSGWQDLCGFLNVPIPPGDYPRSFETRKRASL